LKVMVSASTSSTSPPVVNGFSKFRVSLMLLSDADSVPIGRAIVRESQTLASAARVNAPSAIHPMVRSALAIIGRADASIESST
jgi:hypothetical protein